VAELSLTVDVAAPVEATWAGAIDWDGQSDWMVLTTVRPVTNGGRGVGAEISAFTGVLGRLGFTDPMTITTWEPPYRCVVQHGGRVVRGSAAFEVQPLPDGRSRFIWTEWPQLPLGWLGELGFVLLKPLIAAPIRYSLRRFADWVPRRS
jgi:uncharacterized protein YndB with AHSA1/START domain